MSVKPVEWLGDRVKILDQTRLPQEEVYLELDSYQDIASAITELKIRGAPAIGVAGAYAIALGALKVESSSREDFLDRFREAEATLKLSQFGADLIRDGFTILTHCNTGPLATTGYGTALGVIIQAKEQGKRLKVFADETRPLLQGARLTTWELQKAGIPVTLITDSMAGYFMSRGEIDCVIVGADRIAANGDTANKIGTYTVAVLAKENGIPFYVAAPTTTIDPSLASGKEIPIEQRKPEEVTRIQGIQIAPDGTSVENPAFDVTPSKYITTIITERGIIKQPFGSGIKGIL